jgi:hypothetical protein
MSKSDLEKLRTKAAPEKFDRRQQERAAWELVEKAYEQMEKHDKLLGECLPPSLNLLERELVRAAFAVGRRSYAADCDESREAMRELGLV